MNEKDLYERAIKIWGQVPQMMQVIEEMSELTKELLKNNIREKENLAEIIEETADVEIMLGQLKRCYNIEKEVADYKAEKLKKISNKLDEWENNGCQTSPYQIMNK